MTKNIWIVLCVVSGLLHAMGVDVNYDEQIDTNERANINIDVDTPVVTTPLPKVALTPSVSSLDGLELKSLYFQQKVIDNKNRKIKKYVEVQEVVVGSKVTYINKLINNNSQAKQNIVVRNPLPAGTKYVLGTASCLNTCMIRFSADNGQTFVPNDKGGEEYNYIEFIYSSLPSNKEFRMGFDAIVK